MVKKITKALAPAVLLDTCALIWWTLAPNELSPRARELILQHESTQTLCISSISIWEIGIKVKRGKLHLGTSLEDYVERLRKLGSLHIFPVTTDLWMKNLALDWDHSDPADRTIVATALRENLPLVTSDQRMKAFYSHVVG